MRVLARVPAWVVEQHARVAQRLLAVRRQDGTHHEATHLPQPLFPVKGAFDFLQAGGFLGEPVVGEIQLDRDEVLVQLGDHLFVRQRTAAAVLATRSAFAAFLTKLVHVQEGQDGFVLGPGFFHGLLHVRLPVDLLVVLPQAYRPATDVCVRKVRQLNVGQLDVGQVRKVWQAAREPWSKSVLGHLGQGHVLDGFALALAQNDGIDLGASLEVIERFEEFARLAGDLLAAEFEEDVVVLQAGLGSGGTRLDVVEHQTLVLGQIELLTEDVAGLGQLNPEPIGSGESTEAIGAIGATGATADARNASRRGGALQQLGAEAHVLFDARRAEIVHVSDALHSRVQFVADIDGGLPAAIHLHLGLLAFARFAVESANTRDVNDLLVRGSGDAHLRPALDSDLQALGLEILDLRGAEPVDRQAGQILDRDDELD